MMPVRMPLAGIPTFMWLSLGLFTACSCACAILNYRMIYLVNRKLPPEGQIDSLWLYPGKLARLNSYYKQFYPSGRLLFWTRVLYIAPAAWLVVGGLWVLGIVK
jgi:hypothetical protein